MKILYTTTLLILNSFSFFLAEFSNGGYQGHKFNGHNTFNDQSTVNPLVSLMHPKWNEPYFDIMMPRNVSALSGKSAYLSCRVKNLGNRTVSSFESIVIGVIP